MSISGATDLGYVSVKSQVDRLQADLTTRLRAGQLELEAGKDALKQANSKHDPSLVTPALEHFAAARDNFTAANKLADDSQLLRYLEYAPSLGDFTRSRHKAVDGVAAMGVSIADAGQELSRLDSQLLQPPSAGQAGRTLLTVLAQTQEGLSKVRTDLQKARDAASQVQVDVLPTSQQVTFVTTRTAIDSAVSGLDEFSRLVPVMTDVLGGNGVRTYLVEQVDPSELRAGGGFIGTYTLLRADHGNLAVARSGNAYNLVDPRPLPGMRGFVPLPDPYRQVIPDTSYSFVDSNVYPDYPSSARAAETLVQSRIGNVDGVISIDYFAVARILELTGPLQVPGYGITVDSNNFIPKMVGGAIAADASHKAILATLAGPLMQRVASLPADRWPSLMAALNDLAGSRHLQAYFNENSLQQEIERVGWSGGLNTSQSSDYLLEVEDNYYGDKANYFLSRHYAVSLTRAGNSLHHQVTVDLTNAMPCGLTERTSYRVALRFFVGGAATSVHSNMWPVKYGSPGPPSGLNMLEGWVPDINQYSWMFPEIHCGGGHGQVVLEYDTQWLARDNKAHSIYWQKQPGTGADKLDISWSDGKGHSFNASGDLAQDRVINLLPSGVALAAGKAAAATLPSLSL